MNGFRHIIAIFIISLALISCSRTERIHEWKEEVKLGNGEIVVVSRQTAWRVDKKNLGARYQPTKTSIIYPIKDSNTETVKWETIKLEENGKFITEFPIYFDVDSQGLVTIFTFNTEKVKDHGDVCIYYTKYKYDGNRWQEEVLPEIFKEFYANLLVKIDNYESVGLLTLQQKNELNKNRKMRDWYTHIGPERRKCLK